MTRKEIDHCAPHEYNPKALCPLCSGTGEYAPEKSFGEDLGGRRASDIEYWGAVYWWHQVQFWVEKFIGLQREVREMREEDKS